MEIGAAMTEAPERCTRPPALTVGRNVRFPSNPRKGALSTARIAIGSADRQEETDTRPGLIRRQEEDHGATLKSILVLQQAAPPCFRHSRQITTRRAKNIYVLRYNHRVARGKERPRSRGKRLLGMGKNKNRQRKPKKKKDKKQKKKYGSE